MDDSDVKSVIEEVKNYFFQSLKIFNLIAEGLNSNNENANKAAIYMAICMNDAIYEAKDMDRETMRAMLIEIARELYDLNSKH